MNNKEKKKLILWLSVSIITIIIVIVWGFFLKQNLFSLKAKLQQKKELSSEDLQFKKNLEELKKSLEDIQQGFSDVKTTLKKEDLPKVDQPIVNTKMQKQNESQILNFQKLSPEQTEKIKQEIKKALDQKDIK